MRQSISQWLALSGFDTETYASAEDALKVIGPDFQGVVVSDIKMPGMDGMALLRRLQSIDPGLPVILMTGHGDVPMAVEAMRIGAFDFVEKPFEPDRLAELCHRASEARSRVLETRALRRELSDAGALTRRLMGASPSMEKLRETILDVAQADGHVLILGETGTGKELVARSLHDQSTRAGEPFVAINCGALPETLIESELFGHRKGAFTSADSDHQGWFQQADSGTLFLDEVGELTLDGQAKLLRILEGHPFLPVGGTQQLTVDVRVICATNRDLREFVEEKKFREDLFYRLSVFELYVPPLRERGPDIQLLVEHFLDVFKHKHGRPDLKLSPEGRQKLLGYQWPGNVRQLRNVIDSAVIMADSDLILAEDLGLTSTSPDRMETLRIDHWERKLIIEALQRSESNIPQAAKLLGISRATLYRKIDDYGLKR